MKAKTYILLILSTILIVSSTSTAYAWPFFQKEVPASVDVPIIMYHLITTDSRYQGKYGISPAEMENDLKYLKENGYETIFMSDLINYTEGKRSLPEKPIILTFDDGRGSDYYFLYPLLQKYNMKAVLSIIGKLTDDYTNDKNTAKKPHLMWDQVLEMHKSGVVEIQNHSYNLHGDIGSGKKRSESAENYRQRFCSDLMKCQKQIKDKTGSSPTTFAYPLGAISKGSKEALVSMGFKASLSCFEGINEIKRNDPDCLFRLKRNIRRAGHPLSEVLTKIAKKK